MPADITQVDALILGAAGYGGGELLRLLSTHPAVATLTPVSRSHADLAVTVVHPHLHNLEQLRFSPWPKWEALEHERPLVVFSAMPQGQLGPMFFEIRPELVALGQRRKLVCIDLSADFRLDTPERYQQYYGAAHASPEFLGDFVFGLPEMNRPALRSAQWIANPGCFATALCLTLLPLSGVDGLGLIALSGATGSSGSGVQPSDTTHHPARAHDYRAYNPLKHRHLGEAELVMQQGGARGYSLSFVPHSAPLVRGIFVTAQCLLPAGLDAAGVTGLFVERYLAEPFVRIVDRSPRIAAVAGSNYAEISFAVHGQQLAVLCALDNLGKGMAGQAVHNMNLALGLDETLGLAMPAVYP